MAADPVASFLFAIGALIFAGIIGLVIYRKTKINDIIVLMILGVVIGPQVLQWVHPDIFGASIFLMGSLGLAMVLFNEGLHLTYEELRAILGKVLGFSFAIFFLTAGAVSVILYYLIPQLGWVQAIVLGAAFGAPGPAMFVPVFSRLTLPHNIKRFLILEGIITDSIEIILVTSLALLLPQNIPFDQYPKELFILVMAALVVGFIVGGIWKYILSRYKEKFHYLLTLSTVFITFAVAKFIETSGFLAVFVLGIVIASSKDVLTRLKVTEIKSFQEELTFLIKIFFFVYIGLIFQLNDLFNLELVATAVFIIITIFVVRFALVKLFKIGTNRDLFATVPIFPRGLATAVLTLTLIEVGVVTYQPIVAVVFIVIFFTNIFGTIGAYMHERRHGKKEVKGEKVRMTMFSEKKLSKRKKVVEPSEEKEEVIEKEIPRVSAPRELKKSAQAAIEQVHNTMRAEMAFILMYDKNKELQLFAADDKTVKTFKEHDYRMLLDLGREAIDDEKQVQINDLGQVPDSDAEITSLLVVPIMKDHQAVGAIGAINKKPDLYFEEEDGNYLAVIKSSFESAL